MNQKISCFSSGRIIKTFKKVYKKVVFFIFILCVFELISLRFYFYRLKNSISNYKTKKKEITIPVL